MKTLLFCILLLAQCVFGYCTSFLTKPNGLAAMDREPEDYEIELLAWYRPEDIASLQLTNYTPILGWSNALSKIKCAGNIRPYLTNNLYCTNAAAGQQPFWTNSILNGYGGLIFDGSDDFLACNDTTNGMFVVASYSGLALIAVIDQIGPTQVVASLKAFTPTGITNNSMELFGYDYAAATGFNLNAVSKTYRRQSSDISGFSVVSCYYHGNGAGNWPGVSNRVNTVNADPAIVYIGTTGHIDTSTGRCLSVGCRNANTSNPSCFWSGTLVELIVLDNPYTAPNILERIKGIERYLQQKYGL